MRTRLLAVAALILPGSLSTVAHAQINVTTYHNDNSRTGQNTQESILTPSNVNYNQFGKLFSVTVDADVYAQPLYLQGVSIAGGVHNVVYVATENDSVYAIDADSGSVYAHVNLIAANGSIPNSSGDLGCTDLVPTVGITGTPVIDTTTGTMYLVATSKVSGSIVQYLHALSVTTLAESFGGPVQIQASVPGTASDGNGSTVPFNAFEERQRTGLLLENGHVIIGWSAYCDDPPWHGWVMSYNSSTLAQEGAFNTTADGVAGGVWLGGDGMAADSSGNIYLATGNGTWNGTTDYGNSIVKLGPPSGGSFPVVDYFTPWNQASLYANDLDLASGGLMLLPTLTSGSKSGESLLAHQGKEGTIVLLNQSNLGKYCINQSPACTNSDPQIVQEIPNASQGIWGTPAYWNGTLYWGGGYDTINAYSFNANGTGVLSTTATSKSAQSFNFSAPSPSISANGTADGILWALDGSADDSTCDGGTSNCLGLFAYDATNLSNLLYNSMQAANNRDSPGVAVKFETPTIANGKVYVGTQNALTVYGLLSNPTTAVSVNMSASDDVYGIVANGSAVPGGGIDGGGYALSATLLGSSLTWSGATFNFGAAGTLNAVDNKTITLPAGNYSTLSLLATGVNGDQTAQKFTVTYSDGTTSTFTQSISDWFYPANYAGESIALTMAYRLNSTGATGTGPCYLFGYTFTLNSAKSVVSVTLPANRNVVVLAMDLTPVSGGTPTAAAPTFNPAGGNYTTAQNVSLSDTTAGAAIHYTTNSTTPTASSPTYGNTPIPVSATTTIEAIAIASGYNNSAVSSATYTIGSSGSSPVSVSLASSDNVYGIVANGSAVPGGGIDGGGYALSATLLGSSLTWSGATFNFGAAGTLNAVDNKTITLPAGNYSTLSLLATGVNGDQTAQNFTVTYSDGTTSTFTQSISDWFYPANYAGESIALTMAYRLNSTGATGTGPCYLFGYSFTLNSAKSVVSVTLPANRNVVVLAMDLTPVSGGTPTAAAPTFNPAGGNYTTAQNVSLSDTTAGAAIHYTTNSTTPTASSPTYGNTPIPVSATTTIEAIAIASGYNNSAVSSATYTIGSSGSSPVSVSLASSDNVYGIVANGSAVPGGGIDGGGYALSATLLGSSLTWSGATFNFGAAGTLNAVDNKTITLPAGNYSTLSLLATGVNGDQTAQKFTVTYSDGTTSTFTQSFSDWFYPAGYTGETAVLTMAYRLNSTGATGTGPCYLFGYTFTLNNAKSVVSVTLPANRNVVVLAMDLVP